jgi:hypothetical protein
MAFGFQTLASRVILGYCANLAYVIHINRFTRLLTKNRAILEWFFLE